MSQFQDYCSMTAFASRDVMVAEEKVKISIKSVNHKVLKLQIRHPGSGSFEEELRKTIVSKLNRGTVYLSVEVEEGDAVDKGYLSWLEHCQKENLPQPSWGDYFARMQVAPGLMVDFDKHQEDIKGSLMEVLEDFKLSALSEGKRLLEFVDSYLNQLISSLALIKEKIPEIHEQKINAYKKRTAQLVHELDSELKDDLLKECGLLLEKLDVQEEIDRLSTHFDHFKQSLYQEHKGGKYLDFLCQEIGREINTLSNKSQSAYVSEVCVGMKAELEKIREQVQNLA
ncbi:MAG: DUF1732 domain-containing protein [Planctomycetes bacterium]|nr:DUF1732 domain-containing protein [Planctomycetota bacterium]